MRVTVEHKTVEAGDDEGNGSKETTQGLVADVALEDTKDCAKVRLTLRRFYHRGNPPDHDVDTEKEAASPQARYFKSVIGVALHAQPGAARTADIEGLTALLENAAKEAGMPAEAGREMEKIFGGFLLQDVLAFVLIHPQKPVAAGKSWSRKEQGSEVYPIAGQHVWSLESQEGGKLRLELKAQLKPLPPPRAKEGEPVYTLQVAGTLEGKLEMDAASGWPLRGSFQRRLEGTARIVGLLSDSPADTQKLVVASEYTLQPLEK